MRLAAALLLILGAELAIRTVNRASTPAPADAPQMQLAAFPMSNAQWEGADSPLEDKTFEMSGAHDMINRVYRRGPSDQITMNIGRWLHYDLAVPHKPEVCYPAAGWEIQERKFVTVSPPEQKSFTARLLKLVRNGQAIAVLYWVDFPGQVALDDDDIRQVLQKYRGFGAKRPIAVKCMLQTSANDIDQAERVLTEFAGQIEPLLLPFQK